MKHILTIVDQEYNNHVSSIGCGECQASCQTACKTSVTVGNQHCENTDRDSQI